MRQPNHILQCSDNRVRSLVVIEDEQVISSIFHVPKCLGLVWRKTSLLLGRGRFTRACSIQKHCVKEGLPDKICLVKTKSKISVVLGTGVTIASYSRCRCRRRYRVGQRLARQQCQMRRRREHAAILHHDGAS